MTSGIGISRHRLEITKTCIVIPAALCAALVNSSTCYPERSRGICPQNVTFRRFYAIFIIMGKAA